jgi:hypothetical protein
MHQSNVRLRVRSRATNASTPASSSASSSVCSARSLARKQVPLWQVQPGVRGRQRDHPFDARIERGRPGREQPAAGRAEPRRVLDVEVVEHGLGGLLPLVGEVQPPAQRAALARPVEPDHDEPEIAQREEEWVELLDEPVVAAVEHERAQLVVCRQPEARQGLAAEGHLDAFVVRDAGHSLGERAGEVVVEAVTDVAGRQIELGLVVVDGGVEPLLVGLGLLGELKIDRAPAVEIDDPRCHVAERGDAGGGAAIEQGAVGGVVQALVGQEPEVGHGPLPSLAGTPLSHGRSAWVAHRSTQRDRRIGAPASGSKWNERHFGSTGARQVARGAQRPGWPVPNRCRSLRRGSRPAAFAGARGPAHVGRPPAASRPPSVRRRSG